MLNVAVFRINFVPLSAKDEVTMNHLEYILQSTKAEMKEVLSENDCIAILSVRDVFRDNLTRICES